MRSKQYPIVLYAVLMGLGFLACIPVRAVAQPSSDQCAAANDDFPAEMAQARDLLLVRDPPPVAPADFNDECWNDPQSASAREAIVSEWLKELTDPEFTIIKALMTDVHVLDTFNCWQGSSRSEEAMNVAIQLSSRVVAKLTNFIHACLARNGGFPKGAYEATKGLTAIRQNQLLGGSSDLSSVQNDLRDLYSKWMEDIEKRVKRDHNFALAPAFSLALRTAELLGYENDNDAVNTFMDCTKCHIEIEYDSQAKNSSSTFTYQLSGHKDVKYMPLGQGGWVSSDYQYGGASPKACTITLTYQKGQVVSEHGTMQIEQVSGGDANTGGGSSGMSFDTPISLVVDPCPSSSTPCAFVIRDLGAANEKWLAQDNGHQREYSMPMSLLGLSNTFMAKYSDTTGTNFMFAPSTYQNRQAQLIDQKFSSDMMQQISDVCELHVTVTHRP